LLAGLLDIPEGGCIAMLPSNSKLQKQHVPWIEQLAQWAIQLAPPPQRVHSKREGAVRAPAAERAQQPSDAARLCFHHNNIDM